MVGARMFLGKQPAIRVVQLVLFLLFLAAVKGLSVISPLIPAPGALLGSLGSLFAQKGFYGYIGVTLFEAFSGLILATVVGCAGGVMIGSNKTATDFFNPILLALYSVPK